MLDGDAPVADLLAAAQPAGRRGRVPRAARPRWARARTRARRPTFDRRVLLPQSHGVEPSDRMILGYRCANSRHDDRRRRRPRLRDGRRATTEHRTSTTTTRPRWSTASTPSQGEPMRLDEDTSPTTPRAACRCASSSDRCAAPSTGRAPTGIDGATRRAARVVRRGSGRARRRGRRADRTTAAAGDPLEPVPARAGGGPRRAGRRAGQGRHRRRLRGPLLLGHRDLRRCRSSPTRRRELARERAAVPLQHARRGPRAGARDGPARRAVPVAHDQRRGGVGLLRRRHRAVPHRRRHRLRARCKYVDATGDVDFLAREGVDILVETARLWADLGFWRQATGDARRSTSTA